MIRCSSISAAEEKTFLYKRLSVKKKRILAVDAMRGLCLLGMMLVNLNPDEGLSFPALVHTEWTGISLADVFFPGFLFLAGVSATVCAERKIFGDAWLKNALKRGILLIVIGMVYNHLPCIWRLIFNSDYGFEAFLRDATVNFRPFGVLQRIGFAYIWGIIIYHFVKSEKKAVVSALLILLATTAGHFIFCFTDPFSEINNISIWVDQSIQGSSHNYLQKVFDPEGLYGNITAVGSILFGMAAGSWLKQGKRMESVMTGCALALIGWFTSAFVPVSKPLWTASYVLILSGCFMIFLPALDQLFQSSTNTSKWLKLPLTLGAHSMLTYLISGNVEAILNTVKTGESNLYHSLWHHTVYCEGFTALSCLLCSLLIIAVVCAVVCMVIYIRNRKIGKPE